MKKWIVSLIVLSTLNACGPTAEEIAEREQFKHDSTLQVRRREKVKTDSIAEAAKEELLRQQAHSEEQKHLKHVLRQLRSQLAGEEAKLDRIEGIHLFRSADEKAQQITDQTMTIEELKARINEIEQKIDI